MNLKTITQKTAQYAGIALVSSTLLYNLVNHAEIIMKYSGCRQERIEHNIPSEIRTAVYAKDGKLEAIITQGMAFGGILGGPAMPTIYETKIKN